MREYTKWKLEFLQKQITLLINEDNGDGKKFTDLPEIHQEALIHCKLKTLSKIATSQSISQYTEIVTEADKNIAADATAAIRELSQIN